MTVSAVETITFGASLTLFVMFCFVVFLGNENVFPNRYNNTTAKKRMKQIADKVWLIQGREMTEQEIVSAILKRDTFITKEFLYRQCYPLFFSIFNKYYTDCENVFEFINEIYVFILTPRDNTGRSKLSDFGFRCSLTMWLKIVSENFCHQLFSKKRDLAEENITPADRFRFEGGSLQTEINSLNMDDLQKILSMMPTERYRKLITYRYLDNKTNEETAMLLMLTMANYYNVHLRAKAQFCEILRKEGLI